MLEKHKYLIASALILFIIVMGITVYINRDTIFLHKIEIKYPDGCIEILHNGELVTPICEEGRRLDEENKQRGIPKWNINQTLNLTYQR